MVDLAELVAAFARSPMAVDARRPQAVSSRTGAAYQPGIGPFAEAAAVAKRWSLAIEVKLLSLMGDDNKPNYNMLTHLLAPHPEHRSALTDFVKLADSGVGSRRAVPIYAFDYLKWPMGPAIDAFERRQPCDGAVLEIDPFATHAHNGS